MFRYKYKPKSVSVVKEKSTNKVDPNTRTFGMSGLNTAPGMLQSPNIMPGANHLVSYGMDIPAGFHTGGVVSGLKNLNFSKKGKSKPKVVRLKQE